MKGQITNFESYALGLALGFCAAFEAIFLLAFVALVVWSGFLGHRTDVSVPYLPIMLSFVVGIGIYAAAYVALAAYADDAGLPPTRTSLIGSNISRHPIALFLFWYRNLRPGARRAP